MVDPDKLWISRFGKRLLAELGPDCATTTILTVSLKRQTQAARLERDRAARGQ
jgi:hypothetical protein